MIGFFRDEGASDIVITWNEDPATAGLFKMGATMKFVTTVDTTSTGATTTNTSNEIISKVKNSFVAKVSAGNILQTPPAGASVVPVTDIADIQSTYVETVEVNGATVPTVQPTTTVTTTPSTTTSTTTTINVTVPVSTVGLTSDIADTTEMITSTTTTTTVNIPVTTEGNLEIFFSLL